MMLRSLVAAVSLLALSGAALAGPEDDAALLRAAEANDTDAALAALRAGADPDAADVDGTRALHWAAHHEDVELARRLLREGADPNVPNLYGALAMQEAAAQGNAEMIRVLLRGGADADSRNAEGQTALMAVARTGRLEPARVLIEAGANVNARENWGGQTALMWAVVQRHPEMVRLLIGAGADVNARATERDWERHVTAEPRIKELHTAGLTPLLYAAREGCVECARDLIAAGADVDMPDPDGITPLMLALMNMRYDSAALLIEAGADLNLWDRWGRTALFNAVDTAGLFNPATRALQPLDELLAIDIARILLERGARPNMRLKLIPPERNMVGDRVFNDHILDVGATPLLRAAWGNDVEMVTLLLEHGADVSIPNGRGEGVAGAAVANGGTRIPLKTEDGAIATLEVLHAAGADLNAQNAIGQTPAHQAVRADWRDVVRWLAAQGADLMLADARGRTLMDYASGNANVVELGTTDVVGVLPEMQQLVHELTGLPIPESGSGG